MLLTNEHPFLVSTLRNQVDSISCSAQSPSTTISSSFTCSPPPLPSVSTSFRTTRSGRRFSTISNTSTSSASSSSTSVTAAPRPRGRPRTKSLSTTFNPTTNLSASSPQTTTTTTPATSSGQKKKQQQQQVTVRHQARNQKTGAFISSTCHNQNKNQKRRKQATTIPPPKRRRSSSSTSTSIKITRNNDDIPSSPFKIPFIIFESDEEEEEEEGEEIDITRRRGRERKKLELKKKKKKKRSFQEITRQDSEWEEWNKFLGIDNADDDQQPFSVSKRYQVVEEMGGRGALRKWGWWKVEPGGEGKGKENFIDHEKEGSTRGGLEKKQVQMDEIQAPPVVTAAHEEGEEEEMQAIQVLSKFSDFQLRRPNLATTSPTFIAASGTSISTQELLPSVKSLLPPTSVDETKLKKRLHHRNPQSSSSITLGSRSSTRLALKQSITILTEEEEEEREEEEGKKEPKFQSNENKSPPSTTFVSGEDASNSMEEEEEEEEEQKEVRINGEETSSGFIDSTNDRTADEIEVLEALLTLSRRIQDDHEERGGSTQKGERNPMRERGEIRNEI
ncbi:hypothetical protein JCM5350_003274 [Sporobolomyces pararoseus]